MTLNVVELPKATLADIPRVLRAIADEIEANAYGNVVSAAVVINSDAGLHTFGAGAADGPNAIAMFTAAAHKLIAANYE